VPIFSIGQNLDSLYQIIEGDDADTIRIKTMLHTSQVLQSSDEEEAIYMANSASILAVQSQEYKLAAQSFNQLGLLAYFQGQLKDCKAYFEEAMTYFEMAELPLGIASAGNNIGVIEYEQGFYYNALNYFAESLLIRKANNDSSSISVSYNNIGNVYKDLGQLFKAKEFYQKSIDLKLILNDEYGLAMTYNNLG
jgi:tetratricopeptide (TPR) repeat protein